MTRRFLLFLLLAFALSSCAYFNTFFYAKKHFNAGQKLDRDEKEATQDPQARNPRSQDSYNKSIEQCRKVLDDYADSRWADDANLLMAQAFFFKQDYINARSELHKFAIRFPESNLTPDMYYWLGRTEFAQNNYQAARDVWTQMKEEFPKDDRLEEVDYYFAQTLEEEGEIEQAMDAYRRYAEENNRSKRGMQARISLGRLLMERQEYEECEAVLSVAKDRARDKSIRMEAELAMARLLEKTERLDDALDTYEDLAFDLDKNYREGRITKDEREAVIESARLAAEQARLDSLAFASVLGDSAGVSPEAARLPQAQAELASQNRGINTPEIDQPKPRGALNPFQTEREGQRELLSPKDPEYHRLARVMMREGEVLAKMERPLEAILAYEQIIAEYPKTEYAAEAQFRIAYTQEVYQEDLAAAAKSYSSVVSHGRSSFTQEAQRRASNLGTVQRLSAALGDSVSQEQKAAAEARFLRAELYLFQQERPAKALEEYAVIQKEFAGSEYAAKASLAEAWVYFNILEDRAKGQAKYAGVMRRYPDTKYGEQARRVLRGPDKEPPQHAFMGPDLDILLAEANVASVAARDSLVFAAAQEELEAEETARADSLALAEAAGAGATGESAAGTALSSPPGGAIPAGAAVVQAGEASTASVRTSDSNAVPGTWDPFAVPAGGASPIENIWERTAAPAPAPRRSVRNLGGSQKPTLTQTPAPGTPGTPAANPASNPASTGSTPVREPAADSGGKKDDPKASEKPDAKKPQPTPGKDKKPPDSEKPKKTKAQEDKKDPEKDDPGAKEKDGR